MGALVDKKTLKFGVCFAIAMGLFVFALWHSDGPMSRCEGAGGQMLVGPGGETSCFNNQTFVPLEGFDASGKAN